MILVDSTKYISWMRQGENPVSVLAPIIRSGELVSCGIIRIEVLRGVRKPKAKAELNELFDVVPDIPLTLGLIRKATDLAWDLDRKGEVLPVTDLIIATCARQVHADLIAEDPHFNRIPGLRTRRNL